MFQNVEEAREFFKNDKFATNNGMVIDEIGDDYAICSMDVGPGHINAAGTVMGGAYFTLADLAFAAITNHIHKVSVAIDSNITFLNAAKEGAHLVAKAQMIKTGRRTTYCKVEVSEEGDKLCAVFTGTVAKL